MPLRMAGARCNSRRTRGQLAQAAAGVFTAALLVLPVAAQESRIDHYGAAPERLRALCGAVLPADRMLLLQRRLDLAERVRSAGASDSIWRAYGCTLSLLHALASGDPRPPRISQYALPAVDAFLHVLEASPGDVLASTGVATLGFEVTEGLEVGAALGYAEAFASVSYAAVHAGVTAPIVLRMCTEFALAMSSSPTARYCNHRALSLGVDSTWQLIRSAWLAFLDGDAPGGTTFFDHAIAAAHDSAQVGEAAWHVRGLINEQPSTVELVATWAGLSDSGRVEWVHDRMARPPNAPDASFTDVLVHAEGSMASHGPVFRGCPFEIIRNGARQPVDRSACNANVGSRNSYLGVTAAMQTLWDPATGRPVAVMTYALPRGALRIDAGSAGAKANGLLSFRLWEWETSRWTDTTFQFHLAIPNVLPTPPYVSDCIVMRAPEGTYSWTLSAQQPGKAGRASFEAAHAARDTALSLSDVIVGAPDQKLSFIVAGDTIVLAPWNTLPARQPLAMYFQLRNDGAAREFMISLVLRKILGGRVQADPEIAIRFAVVANPGINGVHQQVDLSHVEGFDHRLEVQVLDQAGRVVAQRSTNLLVR